MTESAIVQAAFVASAFLLFGVFAWMPVTRGPRAFFGVRVEPSYFDGEGKQVLRRYRLVLAGVFLVVAAIAALIGEPFVIVGAELLLGAAAFLLYMRFASVVRPHACVEGATRFASSMRTRDNRNRVWLDAVVAALTLLAFVEPALMFIPALGAYLQLFFYVLRRDFAGAKMTLPADSTEEYLVAKEKYLQTNVDTIDWTRLTIAMTFCSIAFLQKPFARITLFLAVAAVLGGITFFLVRMIRINARLQRHTGNDYAQRAADERHWLHGGLTYSNPGDPALVVEKLVGVGYTLNMAHPGIRSRLLLMSGIPLFVIWAVVAM